MSFPIGTILKPFPQRFWDKVRETEQCWEWQGARATNGYGHFATRTGQFVSAHRLCWMLVFGEIPEGLLVLHTCDNRRCVNPKHLFLGTHSDNNLDMYRKGRRRHK